MPLNFYFVFSVFTTMLGKKISLNPVREELYRHGVGEAQKEIIKINISYNKKSE